MTLVSDAHAAHGATFRDRGGHTVVDHYGRPDRAALAVRRVVGTIEMGYGVATIRGDDRIEFVDNAVSNHVPDEDGTGCYTLLLDPQGGIETDMYVYNAGERLLVFTPPETVDGLVEDWQSKVFIQDVTVENATTGFAVFGVHGPKSTEKVASVLNGAGAPEEPLSFVRGSMGDAGVTVIASDGPLGEEGYEVVCGADDADEVFDTLLNRGLNAAPFGYASWDALSAEAGTPLFEYELRGEIPNVFGLRNAVDFEKGCYVGQEVVSRVENTGQPSRRLVGVRIDGVDSEAELEIETLPGDGLLADDESVGRLTRVVDGPTAGPIGLALIAYTHEGAEFAIEPDANEGDLERADRETGGLRATRVPLPFHEGSQLSARRPRYDTE